MVTGYLRPNKVARFVVWGVVVKYENIRLCLFISVREIKIVVKT